MHGMIQTRNTGDLGLSIVVIHKSCPWGKTWAVDSEMCRRIGRRID